jgi:FkbM family methyltransferase
MSFEISLRGKPRSIDVEYEEKIGIYGKDFWTLINDNAYESETFDFIQRTFVPGAFFFDIGAATGCMSIYAAQLGYQVVALEPQYSVFEALRRNIALNPDLHGNIETVHALVVNSKSQEAKDISDFFTPGASGPLEGLSDSVKRIPMQDLFHRANLDAKTVIKVDIEGAEFNLLRDVELLSELKARNSVMYLSLHPGFLTPLRGKSKFARLVWLAKATLEVADLYFRLRRYSLIKNNKGTVELSLLGILRHLKRDSRDFQINFH